MQTVIRLSESRDFVNFMLLKKQSWSLKRSNIFKIERLAKVNQFANVNAVATLV